MSVEFQKAYEADGSFSEDMSDSTPREYTESDTTTVATNIVVEKASDTQENIEPTPAKSDDAENTMQGVMDEFFDEPNE